MNTQSTESLLDDLAAALSAIESWKHSEQHYLPDFLVEQLGDAIEALRQEVLK